MRGGNIWSWDIGSASQLAAMRAEIRGLLQLAHLAPDDSDDSLAEPFLLAVDELASNGLRHGCQPVRAQVIVSRSELLVKVSDAKPAGVPELVTGRRPEHGGMGLLLVARLSTAHGWLRMAGRKVVWAYWCRSRAGAGQGA